MTAPSYSPDRSEARLFAAGNGVLVCRYPVATDLPIPLGIAAPAALRLLTWAFAGFAAQERDPVGLLVLHDPDAVLRDGGSLTLETHFRDDVIACPRPRPVAELKAPDRVALGGAVLAAMTPETLETLGTLFTLLAPAVADTPLPATAPRLTLARDGDTAATLGGSIVPNYLLLRAGTTWSCARVAQATLRFGPSPEASLTLAPAWGHPRGASVEAALLLGSGSVTAAALPAGGRR